MNQLTTTVQGFAHERFDFVRDLFERNFATGRDIGASFSVTIAGETVVDLWGGWADEAGTRPWQRDTIVNVYSTTKTMTALVALLLADRGALDFTAPVARYWPEFAAAGKADIMVSQLMAHSSGLAAWREPVTPDDLYDWEKMTRLLAAQAPWWEPGTAPGYHAQTQGYLAGEVIRRVAGKTVGTLFREEIAQPLGADFHIGLPASEDHRVADLIPPPPVVPGDDLPSPLLLAALTNPPSDPLVTRTRAWRAAEIPALNGHGNARSIARVHGILANGGVMEGRRFLSEGGCRRALNLQIAGTDLVLGTPARYGLGFGLPPEAIEAPHGDSLAWGGWGGSIVVIDMRARAVFAYAMNRMQAGAIGDERSLGIIRAIWAELAKV
ncbi:serine hydrolase [Sphingopyxis lindanitolerans]|uniref:Serine hydrolase n=1 Tax=Sphingopyxis lindanitolerans TaxID=2054227 RepID=A0A2S8B1K8_9SPHN|nr:serine hydrolase domain-containing protein [Sphingopyxis lindanitolerans]PQM26292.1 serine hydrolase [Sphingopyxis lindanitolerans]